VGADAFFEDKRSECVKGGGKDRKEAAGRIDAAFGLNSWRLAY
jgi:hypothetical protein